MHGLIRSHRLRSLGTNQVAAVCSHPHAQSGRFRKRPRPLEQAVKSPAEDLRWNSRLVKSWSTWPGPCRWPTQIPQKIAKCMTREKPSDESRTGTARFAPIRRPARPQIGKSCLEELLANASPPRLGPAQEPLADRQRRRPRRRSAPAGSAVYRDFRPLRDVPHDGPSIFMALPFLRLDGLGQRRQQFQDVDLRAEMGDVEMGALGSVFTAMISSAPSCLPGAPARADTQGGMQFGLTVMPDLPTCRVAGSQPWSTTGPSADHPPKAWASSSANSRLSFCWIPPPPPQYVLLRDLDVAGLGQDPFLEGNARADSGERACCS